MFIIKTIKGQEVEYENVAAVFDTTRKERNEYFGKYVAEKPIKIGAVATKIKYNPQNEMFNNRKTKRYIFKTKRIFFVSPSIMQIM